MKAGFYWPALLFGTAWAYSEGLIAHGGRLVAVDAMAGLIAFYGDQTGHPLAIAVALLLFIAKNFYCAIRGSHWVRRSLLQQGYRALIQRPGSQVSVV